MEIFLARQAIYDLNYECVAYELLYRSSSENKFSFDVGEDEATMKLISNSITMGFNELTDDKIAFINFSNHLLFKEYPSILPNEKTVIEILETVEASKEITDSLLRLRKKGYKFALDDVVDSTEFWAFGNLIDIYKIDFRATNKKIRKKLALEIKSFNESAVLLAEKIETEEELIEAKEIGCTFFQGYYFSKPIMIKGKDIPIRNTTCFIILAELLAKDFNIDRIEAIIKSDLSISYKIMKMLNSAQFGFVQKITSIRHAIMLIGKEELSKWLTIIAMSEMESGNDEEITKTLIIRARFCELIAKKIGFDKSPQCFLVGLFSNLDEYMQRDMRDIVEEIPVEEEVRDALIGKENKLYIILKLVQAYEQVDNYDILKYSLELDIEKGELVKLYMESINWKNAVENSFSE